MSSFTSSLAVISMLMVTSSAFRILVIPCSHKAHISMFAITGRALQDAGHEVDVLVMESRRSLVDSKGVKAVPFTTVPEARDMETDVFLDRMVMVENLNMFDLFAEVTRLSSALFAGVLRDEALMSRLEHAHYDLAIVDGIDFARAAYLVPYALGLRYVTLTARYDPWSAGVPMLPSVEHLTGMSGPITERSTMSERIANLVKSVLIYRSMPPSALDDAMIARYAPTRPKTTFADLYRSSEIWITNLDTVCLDWPHVHADHFIFVSGLTLQPIGPLPAELEAFVQGSKVGVIVATFGSAMKDIPTGVLEKMLDAFARLEYRVVLRHSGAVPTGRVPANVLMMPWLPQGDLLGHPKTRLFITHGGSNGQYEAVYHGVPMVTIPMFGDQFYNARRAEARGFSLTLDKHRFTSSELVDAVNRLAKDKALRDDIRRCADKLRAMPNAHDTVVFWVDHVIRHGAQHLRPVSVGVPLWQMFMLDVLALAGAVLLLLYTLVFCLCYKLYRKWAVTRSSDFYRKKAL